MRAQGARDWRPIWLIVALVATFVVLITIGTQRPDEPAPAAGTQQAKQDWLRKLEPGEKPPQFVLFSFDGAGSHEHWQRVLEVSRKAGARFTAFLSGVYLLTDEQRRQYTGPGHSAGQSSIGFGGSAEDVRTRIDDLNLAKDRGIEIGTHYNGHFCKGAEPSVGRWTAQQWQLELQQFFRYVDEAGARGLKVESAEIKGGRTPCLEGRFDVLFSAMATRNLTYDSSQTADGITWPVRKDDIWEFALPTVRMPAVDNKKVVMMDYNIWFALNRARDDKSKRDEFARATLEVYRAAYDAAFNGNRAPLVVGNHFNDWAGGGFGVAAEQFMTEVCTRPETVCATYSDVHKWLELQTPATLDGLRKLPVAQT